MKAYVVHGDGSRGIEEVPFLPCGPYEAKVKVLSCGVCSGTDMKIIHRKFKGVENYPVVLGHEGARWWSWVKRPATSSWATGC